MTDDLVARLRNIAPEEDDQPLTRKLILEAADELERLREAAKGQLVVVNAAEARVRELEAQLADQRAISKYNREQAEASERALAEAYERAAEVCDGWLAAFGHLDIQYVDARTYASDAVLDIATAIRKLAQEVKHEAE